MYHDPVLLEESIRQLDIKPDGVYVDATFGGGGHSRKILERLDNGKLLAFDRDPDAAQNKIEDERFTLVNQNFRYLRKYLRLHKALPVHGILADLGISSHQIDTPDRGFSLRFDGPLDMRMDSLQTTTARDIIQEYTEEKLTHIFRTYGELPQSRLYAKMIVEARAVQPIPTTASLKKILQPRLPRGKENHILARIFQALRIEVNDELGALKDFLQQSKEVLCEGGRLVVISYHSLEDRLVKNFMRSGNWDGHITTDLKGHVQSPFHPVIRKALKPSDQEILQNPRARSARLRVAQRTHMP